MAESAESPRGQGGLATDLATNDSHRLESDVNLIRRAIRNGWDVPPEKKREVVERLLKVVNKDRCEVMTKAGMVMLDGPADANAVKAASALVAMTGEMQRDIHAEDKNARLDSGKPTERYEGVQVTVPGMNQ